MTSLAAIVTGAGRGIGAAIARRLAADGFTVVCADQDEDAAARTAKECGSSSLGIAVDVSEVDQCERLVEQTFARLGSVEVLVNNAGINRDAMLHKMTDEQWHKVIAVDLSGVFFLTRAAARVMREQRRGRLVNISSASWQGNIGQANYAAAKAGVVGLTLTAAKELARYQVTANAICPGFIGTPMTSAIPEKIYQQQVDKIPIGRVGRPEDVANVVSFLASEDAAYVTGEVINVGGGYRI
ncbi:MAG TPA: 3-oxoacyl-ACP reductase FabG [Streptosporangiaceae bacterium]|nr:3-oxoacyl-ACP reductase FabG [Streptosporangiaceae bacterium]